MMKQRKGLMAQRYSELKKPQVERQGTQQKPQALTHH